MFRLNISWNPEGLYALWSKRRNNIKGVHIRKKIELESNIASDRVIRYVNKSFSISLKTLSLCLSLISFKILSLWEIKRVTVGNLLTFNQYSCLVTCNLVKEDYKFKLAPASDRLIFFKHTQIYLLSICIIYFFLCRKLLKWLTIPSSTSCRICGEFVIIGWGLKNV